MEDTRREYKVKVNFDSIDTQRKNSLIHEIISFLNMSGGELIVGVDDFGEVVGIEDIDNVCAELEGKTRDIIKPSAVGLITFDKNVIEDKKLLKITISEGSDKPYYDNNKGMCPNGVYVRHGSSKEKASLEWINNQLLSRSKRTIKDEVSKEQELTFDTLVSQYKMYGKIDLSSINYSENLEFYTKYGYNIIAWLFSDQFNIDYYIMEEIDDYNFKRVKIDGSNIIGLFLEVEKYLVRFYSAEFIDYKTNRRVNKFELNEKLIREVLVNAFIHADYLNEIKFPQIKLNENRVEIVSYGKLNVSVDEFKKNISRSKNREILRIFKDIRLVEEFGIGSRLITNSEAAEMESLEHTVRVVISVNKTNYSPYAIEGVEEMVVKEDITILELIQRGVKKRKEIEEQIGMSNTYVKNELRKLIKDGKIIKLGNGKNTYYEAKEEGDSKL